MTPQPARRLKTLALMLVIVCVAPLGDIFLSKGMKQIGAMPDWAPSDVFHFFFSAFTSTTIWLGIGLLLAFFVAYLLVLSWADYSYIQPATTITYAIIALLARYVLHEYVSPMRWAGVGVICLGVFVVGHTQVKTTEDAL
jgi:drug/metabolite transporter (DMT)-like permease